MRATGWIRYVKHTDDGACLRPMYDFQHGDQKPNGPGWRALYDQPPAPWAWKVWAFGYLVALALGAMWCVAYAVKH